jgi:hypothetical protein
MSLKFARLKTCACLLPLIQYSFYHAISLICALQFSACRILSALSCWRVARPYIAVDRDAINLFASVSLYGTPEECLVALSTLSEVSRDASSHSFLLESGIVPIMLSYLNPNTKLASSIVAVELLQERAVFVLMRLCRKVQSVKSEAAKQNHFSWIILVLEQKATNKSRCAVCQIISDLIGGCEDVTKVNHSLETMLQEFQDIHEVDVRPNSSPAEEFQKIIAHTTSHQTNLLNIDQILKAAENLCTNLVNSDKMSVKISTLKTLAEAASHLPVQIRKIANEAKVYPTLCYMLDEGREDTKEITMAGMLSLGGNNFVAITEIVNSNGLKLLVDLLANMHKDVICSLAAYCLALISVDEEKKAEIVRYGGVEKLVFLIENIPMANAPATEVLMNICESSFQFTELVLASRSEKQRTETFLTLVERILDRRRRMPLDINPNLYDHFSHEEIVNFELQFKQLDVDTSGEINRYELSELFKILGEPMPENKLRKLINEVDLDESGSINFNEFIYMKMLRLLGADLVFKAKLHRLAYILKLTLKRRLVLIYLLGVKEVTKRYPLELKIADWEELIRKTRQVFSPALQFDRRPRR